MDDSLFASSPLAVLAELYRGRRSGVLCFGTGDARLRVLVQDGQVVGLGPIATSPGPDPLPRPDDSTRLRLDRILREVGIRSASPSPSPAAPAPSASPAELRERLLEGLADPALAAAFEEGASGPADVLEAAGGTEPLILEAIRRMRVGDAVRGALGDLDRRLVATTALAEERTLTLTEGYLLSRIDGTVSAREVLQLVPLEPEETERALLGLLLTGRVEFRAVAPRPAAASRAAAGPRPEVESPPEPAAEPAPAPEDAAATPDYPEAALVEDEEPVSEPPVELDAETAERRKEILALFQSLPLKNHFEVLGVEPGCTDAVVKRAYSSLAKRYHPDVQRDPRLADLHDVLAAIFIRVGEAWEVLGNARSRASYEARSGIVRRTTETVPPAGQPAPAPGPPPPAPPSPGEVEHEYVPPEETLLKAQLLIGQQRYWDAIQMLEVAVPQMVPSRHQNRGRILLARAYAKNPNWLRRAEETLQDVVREDPRNVDAHYELGLVYKAGGLSARAQAQFRRVVELRPDHREAASELGLGPEPGGGGLLKRLFRGGKAS